MTHERARLLYDIQALEFAAVDLNLYLDTHPTDERALLDYNEISRQLKELKTKYEDCFGPLTNFGNAPGGCDHWKWLDEPWPWEILV